MVEDGFGEPDEGRSDEAAPPEDAVSQPAEPEQVTSNSEDSPVAEAIAAVEPAHPEAGDEGVQAPVESEPAGDDDPGEAGDAEGSGLSESQEEGLESQPDSGSHPDAAADPHQEDMTTSEVPAGAVAESEPAPSARRRRSASRPAGPPPAPVFSAIVAPSGSDQQHDPAASDPDVAAKPAEPDQGWVPAQEDAPQAGELDPSLTADPQAEPAARGSGRSRRATRPTITVSFSSPQSSAPVEPMTAHDTPTLALFRPPEPVRRSRARIAEEPTDETPLSEALVDSEVTELEAEDSEQFDGDEDTPRRRRRRGGRRRRRGSGELEPGAEDGSEADSQDAVDDDVEPAPEADFTADPADVDDDDAGEDGGSGRSRRRRRRRRAGISEEMEDLTSDDPPNTVVKVRSRAKPVDDVVGLRGSTRIEAKKQRRRDGREAGRRRAPILTEAEFLARREAVNRVMAVRQHGDRTQIAVLEDGVLVEHYVNRADATSLVGNVYLGKVQNVLPSMEAAFVDIGRGRNAVLYAGEVNWDAAGMEGQPKRIELALKSGDAVLVQATKDPVGHKGARLTSQISLPGRFLVYVPEGSMTGISRKLPDTERARLKGILKDVVPEGAGVIVRTAAEGATEAQLTDDVRRLKAQWEDITAKAKSANPPSLLYGEPDLAIKVVRDIFNEDFTELIVQGDDTWETLNQYIGWVAPDLQARLHKWNEPTELYAAHRIDEQLAKALDRKVWLPSGGSLVIDRTEAMTVVDVNTGKFTGQGGNLEETVTRNNLEAAEEIVRQLRLRDIGGIIVVDFIDMVLESNRDLVLRRLVECLGRDRTKHQVAEVTSLGLVQMTRKRIGQGLLEVFSVPCEHCNGKGHIVHTEPVGLEEQGDPGRRREEGGNGRRTARNGRTRAALGGKQTGKTPPPPKFDAEGHVYHDDAEGPAGQGEALEALAEEGPHNPAESAPGSEHAGAGAEGLIVASEAQLEGNPAEG